MNAPQYWWLLSLSASCLYALLAASTYPESRWTGKRVLRNWPRWLRAGLFSIWLPILLALAAVGFSAWLTGQSFSRWLLTLEEFGKLPAILLSLQALGFLIHGYVLGTTLLLLCGTLSLQFWLYYQALGIDFNSLSLIYATAVFVVFTLFRFGMHVIDADIRMAFARPLAILVLTLQWAFTAKSATGRPVAGMDWVSPETTLAPIGLILLFVMVGYGWQEWIVPLGRSLRD